jgi:hypothetical protein
MRCDAGVPIVGRDVLPDSRATADAQCVAVLRCAALRCAAACGPFESLLNRTAVEPSLWEDKTLQGRPIGGGSGIVSTTWEDN